MRPGALLLRALCTLYAGILISCRPHYYSSTYSLLLTIKTDQIHFKILPNSKTRTENPYMQQEEVPQSSTSMVCSVAALLVVLLPPQDILETQHPLDLEVLYVYIPPEIHPRLCYMWRRLGTVPFGSQHRATLLQTLSHRLLQSDITK